MQKYIPQRSGNKDYNGVRVSDKYLLFSNEAMNEIKPLKRIDIFIDKRKGLIEIKKGNQFGVPRSEKLITRLTDAGMEKGRYLKIKDFVYEIQV